MSRPLMLHEEVLLLALRDSTGKFSSGMYHYAVAGAMLSELMLSERIRCAEDKHRTVEFVSDQQTGCDLLDELLDQIKRSEKARTLQYWIQTAAGIKNLSHRLAGNLCERGILEEDERKVFFVFTQRVYPEVDGTFEDAIRERMAKVMFHSEAEADIRTGALIALANHAGLLQPNFVADELAQHKDRIKELAEGEHLASNATHSAIQAVQAAIFASTMVPILAAGVTSSR